MAYFPNGTAGMVFDEQCCQCKYGEDPCPIALVQFIYNYEAVGNKTARAILDALVKDDGTCTMFELAMADLAIDIKKSEPLPKNKSQFITNEGDLFYDVLLRSDINWGFFNKNRLPSKIILEYNKETKNATKNNQVSNQKKIPGLDQHH